MHQRRLLGLRLAPDGSGRERLVYPAWQFDPGVLRHLPAVLEAAGFDPDRPVTGWTLAAWFAAADERHAGLTPIDLLRAGHFEPVLGLAREVRYSLGVDEREAVRVATRTAG